VVQQAGGNVDGVAETIAGHFHHLATGERHLQAQQPQARRRAAFAAAGDDAVQHLVHLQGGHHALRRVVEDRHQPVAQGLDEMTPVFDHRRADGVDAVRDDGGRLGIAQGFEEGRAATQVGEQHGAVGDAGHVARQFTCRPCPHTDRPQGRQRLSR